MTSRSALSDLLIDRQAVALALQELGVDLTHALAPLMILGATDVLVALELARSLPPLANFDVAMGQLHTFSRPIADPLPEKVVEVQLKVLAAALEQDEEPVDAARVARLRRRIENGAINITAV
jgi:hypothetical protein